MSRLLSTLVALQLLAGCAGNGEGLDPNGQPVSGGPQPLLPTLDSIQAQVFTPVCTTCHAGASAPLGFRLDAASSFAMLVNAPSVEVSSLMRILPGDPDHSYLIQKLEGHAAVGERMPLGGPYLPQATIDVIRQWVTDGAQPMTAASTALGPTQLRAVAPLDRERLTQPPRELLIAADGELDVSLLEAGTVVLRRSGGDGTFGDIRDVIVERPEIQVRSLAPTVIAIRPRSGDWLPDRYELRIAGHGPVAMTNRAGVAIDGAANGAGGSDFVVTFTVEVTR